jgi:hypothetical protein
MKIGNRIKQIRMESYCQDESVFCQSMTHDDYILWQEDLKDYENDIVFPPVKFIYYLNIDHNANVNWLLTGKGDRFISSHGVNLKDRTINTIAAVCFVYTFLIISFLWMKYSEKDITVFTSFANSVSVTGGMMFLFAVIFLIYWMLRSRKINANFK